MHVNLEKRFVRLAVAENVRNNAIRAFAGRFAILFNALADDLGISRHKLAQRMGWDPVPAKGNKIMRDEASPSQEDVMRLMNIYLETRS